MTATRVLSAARATRRHADGLVRGLGAAGCTGVALLGGYTLVAVFAELLAPFDARQRVGLPYQPPSGSHPLGTDDVGRDLASILVVGTRSALVTGLGVAVAVTLLAATVGALAGMSRGWPGAVLMRLADLVMVLPFLPLLILAASFLGRGLLLQIGLLAALTWPRPARVIRAQVLAARSRGHVEAAQAMGAGPARLLLRHLSYAVVPVLIPLFVRAAMTAILVQAALAFLGLGDPLQSSWGTTLYWANVRNVFLTDGWLWWVLPPGLAIAGLVVALGLIGIAIEDRLNPGLAAEVTRAAR